QRRTAVPGLDAYRAHSPQPVRTPHRHHPHPTGQPDAGRLARDRNRTTHQRPPRQTPAHAARRGPMTPIEPARFTSLRHNGPDSQRRTVAEDSCSQPPGSTTPSATARALPVFTYVQRMLIGVVVSGAVIIAGIGFAGSYQAVRALAIK